MSEAMEHAILRLWVRSASGVPGEPRESLELRVGEGVAGDHTLGEKRHVTLIFEDDWSAAVGDLGVAVDPSARRANVLLSGAGGLAWIGQRMRIGGCLLQIQAETPPCGLMDEAAQGLMQALVPDGRAGVWGRVIEGGTIQSGDSVVVA